MALKLATRAELPDDVTEDAKVVKSQEGIEEQEPSSAKNGGETDQDIITYLVTNSRRAPSTESADLAVSKHTMTDVTNQE